MRAMTRTERTGRPAAEARVFKCACGLKFSGTDPDHGLFLLCNAPGRAPGQLVESDKTMAKHDTSVQSYLWPNWLTLILAVWLFISPWILRFSGTPNPAWDAWIVGVVVAVVSIVALAQMAEWEDWVNLILGIWLFLSPWILGFTGMVNAAWCAWIVGALFFLIGIWGVVAARQMITGHPQLH